LPQDILRVVIITLYENVFQNPELFRTQVSLSHKQSSLDCVHYSKIFFSRNFLKKLSFSRNAREIREIREKKIEIQSRFFYTFGILTTKKPKLASIVYFSQNNLSENISHQQH
jgi:hypothetical protein